ncbi:MAG: TerB family tellurite resistance protein [Candidatus Pelagibacter sp.]|tara:strand:+ start:977 stop:1387 length:411 start_codon:yes stop_codon:yes gene_type:complete
MFFKEKEKNKNNLKKIAALLIHVAKIDEDYSIKEKEIIKQTLLKIGANDESINQIMEDGAEIEQNSNQILEFTKEVKVMNEENKIKIIENLWRIIFSNKVADMYETSLMRRLAGLLYVDSKIMGDIKERIKKEYST